MTMVATYMPWLLSINGIILTYLSGDKYRYVWLLGLGNMALYLVWIFAAKQWGFLPMIIVMTGVYTRNHFKWNVQEVKE